MIQKYLYLFLPQTNCSVIIVEQQVAESEEVNDDILSHLLNIILSESIQVGRGT